MNRDIQQSLSAHLLRATLIAVLALVASTARANANLLLQAPRPMTQADDHMTGIDRALTAIDKAQKQDDAARLELIKAQAELATTVIKLRAEQESGGELVEATRAWCVARTNYVDLARPILETLTRRPDYRAAAAAFQLAQQNVVRVRARAAATTEERIAAGEAVLAAKTTLSKFENAALDADAAVATAKQTCVAATRHLRDQRLQVVRTVQQDPSYLAAKHAVDDATMKAAATDERLGSVMDQAAWQITASPRLSGLTSGQEASDSP